VQNAIVPLDCQLLNCSACTKKVCRCINRKRHSRCQILPKCEKYVCGSVSSGRPK